MDVRTDTEAIVGIRRKTIEMLLQHHPLDCPYCDQSGTCELQDETFDLNIWKSPFETVSKAYPEENLNEVVMINHNRCILCYRCVRVCDEQMGVHALDVSDRGGRSFIVTAQHKFMDCERCGMCIEVCPVGAVLSRPFKHVARAWQTVQADSTCPHCSVGCKIQVESRKGEVLRVRVGEPVEPNRGIVCVKGFFGWSFVNDDERITSPMIRRAGELVEVGWREAIEFVSDRLTAVAEMEGPETIGAVGSGRCTNEDNYALQRLMRSVVGTNNVYLGPNGFAATHQVISSTLGSEAVFHSQDELLESDVVLVIGADINGTHNVLAAHLKAAARKGGPKLIAATRIGSALDVFAHKSVRVRPGAESKLLAAISGEEIADPESYGRRQWRRHRRDSRGSGKCREIRHRVGHRTLDRRASRRHRGRGLQCGVEHGQNQAIPAAGEGEPGRRSGGRYGPGGAAWARRHRRRCGAGEARGVLGRTAAVRAGNRPG